LKRAAQPVVIYRRTPPRSNHALAEIMLTRFRRIPRTENRRHVHTDANPRRRAGTFRLSSGQRAGLLLRPRKKRPRVFHHAQTWVGLGLTVSRKIIETHHGKLEIGPAQAGQPGVVRFHCRETPASPRRVSDN